MNMNVEIFIFITTDGVKGWNYFLKIVEHSKVRFNILQNHFHRRV